ncbi:MAG TPA: RIP metalloprotease RseP [Deltaproteobacteria bacterium]|nr:RIP metalloprotease RseP [Deltaproteobacteria bacterium]
MTTLVSFIIVLGALIFIHELGHFVVAKLSGVGVERFSLGFGPKVLWFRRGETEYRVSLLPLGGYVKMVGEHLDDEVEPAELDKSFNRKPVRTRAAIVAAGSVMNLVLAALLLPLIYMIGIEVPAYLEGEAVIGYVAEDGAAGAAGIKKGDVVTAVDGRPIRSWEELATALVMNPDKPLEVEVRRDGETFTTVLTPQASQSTGGGVAGLLPPMEPVIGRVSPGYPAEAAGLEPGDRIAAIEGREITHWAELEGLIHNSDGPLELRIVRGSESFTVEITPRFNEEMGVYLIGISRSEETVHKSYGLIGAVRHGMAAGVKMTVQLFVVIKGLVVGDYSLKTLGGPIMIAQAAGQAAESGVTDLLSLMAFLSLQLGIINLFPIPVLDGGHLVFLVVEAARGRPLSERVVGIAQQVGLALLITLMVLVSYNDVLRLFG